MSISCHATPTRWLWAGVCCLGLTLSSNAALPSGVRFYKPNREARLVVTLKNKPLYTSKPIQVGILLSNQSMEPILINKRMRFNEFPRDGEIAFVIEGPQQKPYHLIRAISPRELQDSHLQVLNAGETMEQQADLTDLYGLRKKGHYKVQVLYYNHARLNKNGQSVWSGDIASEISEFDVK